MLETEVHNTKSAGFSRRSVVKGAAWTAPVIAAAIAAPAAAASARTATVAFTAIVGNLPWKDWTGGSGQPRRGTAPASFTITNTAGVIPAGITGTLVIAPDGAPATGVKDKGMGIATITGGAVASRNPAIRSAVPGLQADTVTTSFSLTAEVASEAKVTIPLTFGYQPHSGTDTPNPYLGTFTATLTLYSGTVQIGSAAVTTLTRTS